MASTELVRRFPDNQGFRTRADIPTFTMMTSYALAAYSHGHLTAADLGGMMNDFRNYQDPDYWNPASIEARGLLMSACMGHQAVLIRIEARMRKQARAACIGAYADAIMSEIHADMANGFPWGKRIPGDVGSFSGLHDYCDANEYLLAAVPESAMLNDSYIDLLDAVSDEVDRRLAAEAVKLDTGERCECGRLVRFSSGHVLHIDDRSHACHPCEFCLRCPACFQELEYSGQFDGREPSSLVSHGHEGFGETYMCEVGHWYTFLQGAMIAPQRILTVVC